MESIVDTRSDKDEVFKRVGASDASKLVFDIFAKAGVSLRCKGGIVPVEDGRNATEFGEVGAGRAALSKLADIAFSCSNFVGVSEDVLEFLNEEVEVLEEGRLLIERLASERLDPGHSVVTKVGNGVVDLGNVVWEARPLSVDDEVDAEEVVLELGFDLAVERLGRGDLGFFGVDLWGLRARTFFEESSQSFVLVLSCLLCSRRCLLCSLQGLNTVEGGVEGLLHEGGLSACGCRHLEEVERLENEVEGRKDEVEGREDEVEVLEVEVERVIDEVEEVAKVGGVKSKRSKKLRSKGCLTSYGELLSIPRSIFKSPRTRAVRDGTVAQVVPVAIDKEGT